MTSRRIGVPVLDAQQAADWDEAATERGIPSRVLMEAAGRGAAEVIARDFEDRLGEGVLVVAGPGNNGGDGWVVARALAAVGVRVAVADTGRGEKRDCRANRDLALQDGVDRLGVDQNWPGVGLVVDALLGAGASGEPRGAVGELAARAVALDVPIAAIDGPTGLDLSTGEVHGPVHAALTVTFGGFRRGHLLARDRCGRIVVLDIGFGKPPAESRWPELVDDGFVNATLPGFRADMHKGDRGRLLVVGGQPGMAGAVIHAARAAFSAGVGLVKLAVHPDSVAVVQAALPDAMAFGCALSAVASAQLDEALSWADSVVLGPGLGRGVDRTDFVRDVLEKAAVPVTIDADALHNERAVLGAGAGVRVLTPHPGEFRVGFPDAPSPADCRFDAPACAVVMLREVAGEALSPTVLLKGVPTVIDAPGSPQRVVASGNPGLATGGSGDVLAGLIGAFLAAGVSGPDAAACGAHLLGRAAELAATTVGVRAMRPADVTAMMPESIAAMAARPDRVPPVLSVLEPPALS